MWWNILSTFYNIAVAENYDKKFDGKIEEKYLKRNIG